MEFFEVFDIYFLSLTLAYCLYTYVFISKSYRKKGDFKAFNLMKKVSITVSIITIMLYIAGRFV